MGSCQLISYTGIEEIMDEGLLVSVISYKQFPSDISVVNLLET